MNQQIILTLTDYYLPGYNAGGPIRTLANMVERLGDEFNFLLITNDRDSHDGMAYPDVQADSWQRVGKADVYYGSPQSISFKMLGKLIKRTRYDLLYLNSFFSFHFTIIPLFLRWFHLLPNVPVILAPRGEFSPGALELKKRKKQVFIGITKMIGFYSNILWHASSSYEEEDIRRIFGERVPVMIAPNLVSTPVQTNTIPIRSKKNSGELNVVFLSRISRKKNLDGALRILKEMSGEVHFNIYGSVSDQTYWEECQKIIAVLSNNITVQYHGSVPHKQVSSIFTAHDLFFLPTRGENFGHVILEALLAGRPVLISDQTPWRDLEEKQVGWDIPLNQPEQFREVLTYCLNMKREEHTVWCERARECGLEYAQNVETIEQNRHLFYEALRMGKN